MNKAPMEHTPLNGQVRKALDNYFDDLDGTDPNNLYQLILSEVELPLLQKVMEHTAGNQTKAAVLLGINRTTLRKKLKFYKVD